MGALSNADGEISLQRYVRDVGSVIRALGKPTVIVAHSMGAQIAELSVVENASLVAGMVLIAPVPLSGVKATHETLENFKRLGDPEAHRQARRQMSHNLSDADADFLGRLGDLTDPGSVPAIVDVWNDGHPSGVDRSTIEGPVLLIRGVSDPMVTDKMIDHIAGRFENVRSEVVEKAGHWLHVEQPEAIAKSIEKFANDVVWSRASSRETANDWKSAFATRSGEVFAKALSEDVVIEAPALYKPVRGRDKLTLLLDAVSKIYASVTFTHQASQGRRQYLEWELTAFGGAPVYGITVITRNDEGEICHLAVHHRPLGVLLQFSATLGERLRGVIDSSHFMETSSLPEKAKLEEREF